MDDIDFEFGHSIGATHYNGTPGGTPELCWYKFMQDKWWYLYNGHTEWDVVVVPFQHVNRIPERWSIYNNDKPLAELDDDQAAELFNHWRNGGQITYLSREKWCLCTPFPTFDRQSVMRATKSTRDEFIDAAGNIGPAEMFDSGKFKLVEGDMV